MTEKKTRKSIPLQNKVRAELQREINSKCPFCDSTEVGHFEIHHIDENPANNEVLNLILVCPTCHSKITKGDYSPMEVLQKKILYLPKPGVSTSNVAPITFNKKVNNAVIGNNNNVTIKQSQKNTQKYPTGCIGSDTVRANYVSHLISRYHQYKEAEVGKEEMNYAIFPAQLKKKYKIGASRSIYNLPFEKFDDLVSFIQSCINKTTLAKKRGSSHKNYSTFQEYKNNQ